MKSDSSPGVDIAAAPAEPTVARRERILIIDDEENLRSNLADYLFLSGYTVETAADGKHALEALSSGEYDLVLCDLKLPTIDGSVVIERAREIGAKLIGIRVATVEEHDAVASWLSEDRGHRAILFHSAVYPDGYRLFAEFPEQTSFGDIRPEFSR